VDDAGAPNTPGVLDSTHVVWESGLGRNLIKRFSTDRTIPEDDLIVRIEYAVSLDSTGLRFLTLMTLPRGAQLGRIRLLVFRPTMW